MWEIVFYGANNMNSLLQLCALLGICISISSAAATVYMEESGTATGTGLHTMTLDIPGNLTTNESQDVLAYHGYNVTYAGLVGLNGTTWHIIRCDA